MVLFLVVKFEHLNWDVVRGIDEAERARKFRKEGKIWSKHWSMLKGQSSSLNQEELSENDRRQNRMGWKLLKNNTMQPCSRKIEKNPEVARRPKKLKLLTRMPQP